MPAPAVSDTRWDIDPYAHADGVYYLPAGIELQPSQPGWGRPDLARLRERVAADRPHGAGGRKLLCLLCMRLNADRGLPPEPVWMTYAEGHRPVFRHVVGGREHAEHVPESDIHKALKEREADTWEITGAQVSVEPWRPRAKRRPDVLAVTADLSVAGEIQHTAISPRVVGARQRALAKDGDRVVWTTDRDAAAAAFLHRVPHLVVPALHDHRLYRRATTPQLSVVSGWTAFEIRRCGWSDMWSGTTRCPLTGRSRACGRLHHYPTLNAHAYRPDPHARFPCGTSPDLDHLLEGVLTDTWRPYRLGDRRTTWVPTHAYDQVVEERGGGALAAEQPSPVIPRQRTSGRVCEQTTRAAPPTLAPAPAAPIPRWPVPIPAPDMPAPTPDPQTTPGERLPTTPDDPPQQSPDAGAHDVHLPATWPERDDVHPGQTYGPVMINPGTRPVSDAREDLAAAALTVFLTAVAHRATELEQVPIRYREASISGDPVRVPDGDRDGRFCWDIPFTDDRHVRLLIPGSDLTTLQDLGATAPCLFLGDTAAWWHDAIGLLAGEGMRLKPEHRHEH